MNYVKPQLLNTKRASAAIMGTNPVQKTHGKSDNDQASSVIAYRSDE
jgi:hypothetical protein